MQEFQSQSARILSFMQLHLRDVRNLTFLFSPFMTINDMPFAEGFAGASGEMELTA